MMAASHYRVALFPIDDCSVKLPKSQLLHFEDHLFQAGRLTILRPAKGDKSEVYNVLKIMIHDEVR